MGGWKSREMVDRYAKYATTHLAEAAMKTERVVLRTWEISSRSRHVPKKKDLALQLSP